jgi:hypothetical protein
VPSVDDFIQRQRAASDRIVAGLGRIAQAKGNFTRTVLQSVGAVVNAPGGEAGRAREAVRLVGPSIEAIERALEAETPEIMAAVAELSDNWQEHERIWDDLGPEDLKVATEAERSVRALREAIGNARESDWRLKESLEKFAALDEEPAAATRSVLRRLEGVMAALDEHRSQADDSLRTIRAIVRRLRG